MLLKRKDESEIYCSAKATLMFNKIEFVVVCDGGFSLGCFLLESVICKQGRLATLRMVAMTTDVKAPPVSWLPLFSTVLLSWGGLSAVVLCIPVRGRLLMGADEYFPC